MCTIPYSFLQAQLTSALSQQKVDAIKTEVLQSVSAKKKLFKNGGYGL
jgi:hydroxymethylpyrimidine/phosphomethylpyrimidine kinase